MRSEGCRGRAFTTAPRRRRTVLKCGSSSKANHSPPKPNSIRRRACRMLSTRPHEDVLCSTHQQEHSVINLRFGKSLATSDELACHCLAGSLLSRTLREGNIGFHNILPASLLNLYLSKGFGDGSFKNRTNSRGAVSDYLTMGGWRSPLPRSETCRSGDASITPQGLFRQLPYHSVAAQGYTLVCTQMRIGDRKVVFFRKHCQEFWGDRGNASLAVSVGVGHSLYRQWAGCDC